MDEATRQIVRERAGDRCEYCLRHQHESPLAALHVEHVRPKKHRGTDDLVNLALACVDCNLHKGSDIAGYDPETDEMTELFNPRRHHWSDHFTWSGISIVGTSAIGRTTIEVLQLNSEERLELRAASQE